MPWPTPIKIANGCFRVGKSRVAKAVLSGSSATKINAKVDRKSFQSIEAPYKEPPIGED